MHLLLLKQVSFCLAEISHSLLYSTHSSLNRARRKVTPPIPRSSEFDIPEFYSQTLDGKQFICTDKIIKKKTTIIFATDAQLEILFLFEWIFLDGTFDSCPEQFQQRTGGKKKCFRPKKLRPETPIFGINIKF